MNIHLRAYLGKYLAAIIGVFIPVITTFFLLLTPHGEPPWIKIILISMPSAFFFASRMRTYRPNGMTLFMAFPTNSWFSNEPKKVSIHHKLSGMLKIIFEKNFSKEGINFRKGAHLQKRLLNETIMLALGALRRGYNVVEFSSVHLNQENKYNAFVSSLQAIEPRIKITSSLTKTSLFERILMALATSRHFNKMQLSQRKVAMTLAEK